MRRPTSPASPARPRALLAVALALAVAGVLLLLWPAAASPARPDAQATPVAPLAPTATGPAVAPASSAAATSSTAAPTPILASDSGGQHEVEPEGDPVPGGIPATAPGNTSEHAAAAAASAFLTAFARPSSGAGWWERVQPLLTPQAALDYAGTDPARVPYTRLTGPALIQPVVDDEAHLVTFVRVPTDAGVYLVHLQHFGGPGWLVSRVTPPAPGSTR